MDHLFEEISARVNDLLLEQGSHINVQLFGPLRKYFFFWNQENIPCLYVCSHKIQEKTNTIIFIMVQRGGTAACGSSKRRAFGA